MTKEEILMTTECVIKNNDALVEKLIEYISAKVPGFSSTEHLDNSFSSLGLDSVAHVEITAIIAEYLQVTIDPALAFDYPTINSLINYLQQNFTQTIELKEEG
jgi:acyl carrier protein